MPPAVPYAMYAWAVVPLVDFISGMWNIYQYDNQDIWNRVAKVEGTVAAIGITLWTFGVFPNSGLRVNFLFGAWSKLQLGLEAGMSVMNYYTEEAEEDKSTLYMVLHYIAAVTTLAAQWSIVDYENDYRAYWDQKTAEEEAKAAAEAAAAEGNAVEATPEDPYATAL